MGVGSKTQGNGIMQTRGLNAAARTENARALSAALGIEQAAASAALDISILVTVEHQNSAASVLGSELIALLERTVLHAGTAKTRTNVAAEVVIGNVAPQTTAPHLFVSCNFESLTVSRSPIAQLELATPHPIIGLLCACYIAGIALDLATHGLLRLNAPIPFVFSFSQLGLDLSSLDNDIFLETTHLAGAGAVGNGFLWALRHLNAHGELHVIDYDHVEGGNLNRQIWFSDDDISQPKASRLAQKAQPYFSHLRLIPRPKRLQELEERSGSGVWLSRLVVAVDSRRARRSIQTEFPKEVFDASTTDIREVVVHYHKQPVQTACLSCIYTRDEAEISREQHVADHLGVSVDKVRELIIDEASAQTISARFPSFPAEELVGIAYETLFKSLCGEKLLLTPEGRQIVAPFAFVSVLAGTILALEIARRLQPGQHTSNFNYWRLSAWHPPLKRMQRQIPRIATCEFCGNEVLQKVARQLWG